MAKIRAVILSASILLVLAQLLFDPLSKLQHALRVPLFQEEFSKAQARWNAKGVRDYSFEISGNAQTICAVHAVIEVRDSVVVEVKPLDSNSPLPPGKWAEPDWGNEVFLCDYHHFTLERIFNMLAEMMEISPASVLDVEFDPQYGFVTHYQEGIFIGHGWLSSRIQSTHSEFEIKNFQER